MNNYEDIYGRLHHKPVTVENPIPSNNSWLYTAYAKKLGLPVDEVKLDSCYDSCLVSRKDGKFHLNRSPNKNTPPMSRDEILGLASLDLLPEYHIYNWNFSPFPLPKFSALKLLKQLYEIRPVFSYSVTINTLERTSKDNYFEFKHRNYFWQNNLDQLYRFAFSVPLTDRHFILNNWGKFQWYNPVHLFYKAVAWVDSKTGTGSGIRWLKYGVGIDEMVKEFPADHPIRVKLEK